VDIFDRRLVLVVGKGGVGRSTVAAAIAAESAERGKKDAALRDERERSLRFVLREVRRRHRAGAARAEPLRGQRHARIGARRVRPMILKFKTVYEMVFENRVTKAFLRAIPGLDEYSLIGKLWYHTTEEKRGKPVWDTVVFDMPASGHSISMLRVPWVIVDTAPRGR